MAQLAGALRAAERAYRGYLAELRQGDVEPVEDWSTWYAESTCWGGADGRRTRPRAAGGRATRAPARPRPSRAPGRRRERRLSGAGEPGLRALHRRARRRPRRRPAGTARRADAPRAAVGRRDLRTFDRERQADPGRAPQGLPDSRTHRGGGARAHRAASRSERNADSCVHTGGIDHTAPAAPFRRSASRVRPRSPL